MASLGFGPTPVAAAPTTATFTGSVAAGSTSTNWKIHKFTVSAAGPIDVVLDWDDAAANLNVGLRNPAGTFVKWASTANKPERLTFADGTAGDWAIGVKAASGAATYTASVTTEADAPTGSGGTTATASFSNPIDSAGTSWRVHKFTVSGPGTIDVVLDWDNTTADLNVGLRNPAGTFVKWASTKNKPERLTFSDATAGDWAIGIKAVSGAATYTASVTYPSDDAVEGPVAPVWAQQIGGSGRAEMYPSGIDVARPSRLAPASEAGWVFVADTGNDRTAAYTADGKLLWQSGIRGRGNGQFSEPRDIAYLNGRLYVADTGNNRIQVLDASNGQWIATWPTFIGAAMGVTPGFDPRSNSWKVIVADGKNSRISIHDPADTTRVYVGSFGKGDGQLNEVRDGAFDSKGNLYTADFRNHRVAVFDATADGGWAWRGSFGSLGGDPGQFRGPYGIEVDDADGVYVADANNQRIQKLTTSGAFLGAWGSIGSGAGQTRQLRNVAVGAGANPDVFAVDLWGYKIEQWGQGGAHKRTFAGQAPPLGRFNKPYGLTVGGGKVFVADTVHHRIQRFSGGGVFESSFGDRGWAPNLNGLNWPRGVAYDAARNMVWVADTKNWRVTEFTVDGTPTGVTYGKIGAGDGGLNWPSTIAPVGNGVVIADTYNHRIVRWDPDTGTQWTATGFKYPKDVKVYGDTVYVADSLNRRIVTLNLADGTAKATIGATVLHRAEGVAVASDGDIWVADTAYNQIVEFSPSGVRKQVYGGKGDAHGKFWEPTNIQIQRTSAGDRLYVADTFNDRIEVFDIR